MIEQTRLDDVLTALGLLLASRGQSFEIVVVGGGGLLLLNTTTRPTQDLDVVALVDGHKYRSAQPLPEPLRQAAEDIALVFGLAKSWLNDGPTALLDFGLPDGFGERSLRRTYGALTLHIASRLDQIHLKLYASVDQGPRSKHVADLRGLQPTPDELLQAARWTRQHDPSEAFRQMLVEALTHFGVQDASEHLS